MDWLTIGLWVIGVITVIGIIRLFVSPPEDVGDFFLKLFCLDVIVLIGAEILSEL
jgi:hypothetical protein